MLLSEVMELPASEIMFWKEYYDIFPFPQERDDLRTALLAERITNMISIQTAGRNARMLDMDDFMPKYLSDTVSAGVSLAKQIEADKMFASKLMEVTSKAQGN